MASADNANPTILNVSEISRRREKRKVRDYSAKKHGIQSILMAKPSDALDPFYMSDFSDEDSDDSGLEPIDEQEIYGKHFTYFYSLNTSYSSGSRYFLAIYHTHHTCNYQYLRIKYSNILISLSIIHYYN